VTRPEGLEYQPGQGIELAIDLPDWRDRTRPFTPTSLPEDRVLEFTIKTYPEHHGVTEKLHTLRPGAALLISEPFGTITWSGPGTFIAAGAGITPFMAIIRMLAAEKRLEGHGLLFSNKTPADIICAKEFSHYLGGMCRFLCSRESGPGCEPGRIDRAFLEQNIDHFDQQFYVCGPPPFVRAVNEALSELGASPQALVFEK
jgi:cytochrome-b5 reductase